MTLFRLFPRAVESGDFAAFAAGLPSDFTQGKKSCPDEAGILVIFLFDWLRWGLRPGLEDGPPLDFLGLGYPKSHSEKLANQKQT